MTEITDIPKSLLYPLGSANSHLVDPVAFASAMVGGPLIVGVLGAPVFFIPSFALIFGGPIYLLVGVPVMLFALRRNKLSSSGWALLALTTHVALFAPIFLLAWLQDGNIDGTSLFLLAGCIFAPTWGAVSGVIYRRLERDFFKQTI